MSAEIGSDDYWKNRWIKGDTNWQRSTVDQTLQTQISFLHGFTNQQSDHVCTVFVPLCGKSLDMVWLEEQGLKVIGCEISELAIEQFFEENSIQYEKKSIDKFTIFNAKSRNIHLYAGSIYDLTPSILGSHSIDSIWDCRSIIAVNPEDRVRYTETLLTLLCPGGRILMITYAYDQSLRSSFPLSVPEDMVRSLFSEERCCSVELVETIAFKDTNLAAKFNLPDGIKLVFRIEKLK